MDATAELLLKVPGPAITAEEIAAVIKLLGTTRPDEADRKKPGWWTARELAVALEFEDIEEGRRHVREVAGVAAPAIVSYPGSPGYKLWKSCTIDEINHCIETFRSQATDMIKRSVVYQQAYYRCFRGRS